MPTYEYHCDACEHHFDEFQSILEEPLKKCPECHKSKLRRIFGTGAAILFKGSGFYQTDYRSDSYKAAAKADQEGAKPAAEQQSAKPAAEQESGQPAAKKTTTPDASSKGSAAKKGKAAQKTSKSSARVSDD